MADAPPRRAWRYTSRGVRVATFVGIWVALTVLIGLALFLHSSRTLTVASHDAVLRPNLGGHVVVHTGPVLPDLRLASGSRIGVDVQLGKTDAESTSALVERYALIASQPEGPEVKVREAITSMVRDAVVRGAALGLVPLLVWLLIGRARRRELARGVLSRRGLAGVVVVALVGTALWEPWDTDEATVEAGREWQSLGSFLGPEVSLPAEVEDVEVRGDVTTSQTRRLIESAINTYDKSKSFYAEAAEKAAALDLRRPEEGETVVTLIADRHDNIGMDAVARAVGDAGGATAVFDAGDDTSAGKTYEAFSLDSVTAAFEDIEARWGVAGNHDNGPFVATYLADHGWTMLHGDVVDGPDGVRLLGVDDPRSSGLGSWRDETGLSFDEVGERLADAACAADEDGDRVTTILVHDANLGKEALDRGCTDLVLAGHLHVQVGPTRVVGENGRVGYSYTTGTTGGAAYAIAIGSKPRREAEISLVTYAEGRPVGIQPVKLQTNGRFNVGEYVPLILNEPADSGEPTEPNTSGTPSTSGAPGAAGRSGRSGQAGE